MHRNSVPSQSTISSYFHSVALQPHSGKRTTSPIDLTVGDEGYEPPLKRARISGCGVSTSSTRAGMSPQKTASTVADSWRFSPDKAQARPPRPRTSDEKARHEAFKRRLLSDNSLFLKEPDQDEPMDEANEEDSGDESDRFQKLNEMFSHQGKGRGKSKGKSAVAAKHAQKTMEIGPSGQSYTPLEKQVCYLYVPNILNVHRLLWYRSSS